MELIKDNEGAYDRTDDDKSIEETLTNNPIEEKVNSGQLS
jgi:hypothetical protein